MTDSLTLVYETTLQATETTAMKPENASDLLSIASSLDTLWVLLGAMLVFIMQAGFAMVEAGFARTKNTANILMKNLLDFSEIGRAHV